MSATPQTCWPASVGETVILVLVRDPVSKNKEGNNREKLLRSTFGCHMHLDMHICPHIYIVVKIIPNYPRFHSQVPFLVVSGFIHLLVRKECVHFLCPSWPGPTLETKALKCPVLLMPCPSLSATQFSQWHFSDACQPSSLHTETSSLQLLMH